MEKPPTAGYIFVQAPAREGGRKIVTVDNAHPDMLVRDFKRMLEKRLEVAAADQLLIYGTKALRDETTLCTYDLPGVQPTVHLSVKRRGGCFVISISILMTLALAALAAPCTCGASLCLFLFLVPPLFVLPCFCL